MDAAMANYVDPRFRYVLTQVPDKVRSREHALAGGLNCITLAHLVIQDMFGYSLPSHYQATELSADREHFETVRGTDSMVSGDLLWFGTDEPVVRLEEFVPRFANGELLNFDEFPINHVGIYTGDRLDDGDHLVLHASPVDGSNAVWPLSRFSNYPRYGTIYKIMRLRESLRGSAR